MFSPFFLTEPNGSDKLPLVWNYWLKLEIMLHSSVCMVDHLILVHGRMLLLLQPMHKMDQPHQPPIYIIDKRPLQPHCKNHYHIAYTQVCLHLVLVGLDQVQVHLFHIYRRPVRCHRWATIIKIRQITTVMVSMVLASATALMVLVVMITHQGEHRAHNWIQVVHRNDDLKAYHRVMMTAQFMFNSYILQNHIFMSFYWKLCYKRSNKHYIQLYGLFKNWFKILSLNCYDVVRLQVLHLQWISQLSVFR